MQSVYRLKASELDDRFIQGLKSTYKGKEIEIIVCEVDENKHLFKSIANQLKSTQPIENVDNKNSIETDLSSLSERRAFLKLPINERRKILAEQAENIQEHYL
ncbi:MAG: hypothetical protein ACFCAD_09975 [Pleurocapsa sp.]